MIVAVFVAICCLFLRLLILRKNINLSIIWFYKKVCRNVLFVALLSIIVPVLIYYLMPEDGWVRFIIVCGLCLICSLLSILRIGCSSFERQFIYDKVYSSYAKFLKNK